MTNESAGRYKGEIPTGIGGKNLKSEEERLPSLPVRNKVLWVNEDLNLPFKLEVGKESNVVSFLTPNQETQENARDLTVHESHHRSALLGRVIISDKEGNLYRDIDQKGGGFIERDPKTGELKVVFRNYKVSKSTTGPLGFVSLGHAMNDRDMAELFNRSGIRTYRVAAIIKLNELVDEDGSLIPVGKAMRKGIIPTNNFTPVVEMRVYGIKMRIEDADEISLEDAIKMVAQETGNKKMNYGAYASWFAETLGTELGKIHALGYRHGYMTAHNITLDCRIVDLDSVSSFENDYKTRGGEGEREYEADRRDDLENALISLGHLFYKIKLIFGNIDAKGCEAKFLKAYEQNRNKGTNGN